MGYLRGAASKRPIVSIPLAQNDDMMVGGEGTGDYDLISHTRENSTHIGHNNNRPELIANGDFKLGLDDWDLTLGGGGTIECVESKIVFTQNSSSVHYYASQDIATVVGKFYKLVVNVVENNGSFHLKILVGTNQTGSQIYDSGSFGTTGMRTVLFMATATTTWITLDDGQISYGTSTWDNISVKEFTPKYGEELVTDGGFDGTCGVEWICGENWQISGSSAQVIPPASGVLIQVISGIELGTLIKVTVTVANVTTGNVRIGIHASGTGDGHGVNGTFSDYYHVSLASNKALSFTASATFDGNIDNVSIKQVTPMDKELVNDVLIDETDASFGPTNHGLSLVDGQAFLEVDGVDLASTIADIVCNENTYGMSEVDYGPDSHGLCLTDGVAFANIVGFNDHTREELGSELVTDGGFDTGCGEGNWVCDSEWTISGSSAYYDAMVATKRLRQSGFVLSSNNLYKLTFTISNTVAARFAVYDYSGAEALTSYNIFADGTHNLYLFPFADRTGIRFTASNAGGGDTFNIDNVSIKQVLNPGLSQYASSDARNRLRITDSSGYSADGFIKEADYIGPELVVNGDMETGDPPTSYDSLNSTLSALIVNPYNGLQSLSVAATSDEGRGGQTVIGLFANKVFRISIYLKSSAAGHKAKIRIYERTAGNVAIGEAIATAYTEYLTWTSVSLVFNTTATTGMLDIQLSVETSGEIAYFDDVSLKEVTGTEILGGELWDADAAVFTDGTYNWTAYSGNTIENDNNSLKITYDDDSSGAFVYLNNSDDLSSNLTVGSLYKLTFDAKVGAGDSVDFKVGTHVGADPIITITETDFTSKVIYFMASTVDLDFIRSQNMDSGEIIWLDNLSLKEVTHVGETGVHIVSAKGGSTRNWTNIDSNFDYNDSAYTFDILEYRKHDRMMVLTDSNDVKAYGYIGDVGGVEVLGSNLWDSDASVFTSGTYSWVAQASNTIANVGNTLEITYVDDNIGAWISLSNASDLSSNLIVGSHYKLSVDAKINTGSASIIVRPADGSTVIQALTTSIVTYIFRFTASHTTGDKINMLGMSGGQIVTVDNIVLQEVTNCNNDGVHIVSTKGGSTRNWTSIEAGFDYNDSAYTFNVVKLEPRHQLAPETLGGELVTNGTFDSDITGWTTSGNPYDTFGHSSGALHIVSDGTGLALGSSSDDIALIADKLYVVKYEYNVSSGSINYIGLRQSEGSGNWYVQLLDVSTAGSVTEYFVATTTENVVLSIINLDGTAGDFTIDNVSVKQVLFPAKEGVLLEAQASNVCLQSRNFDQSPWANNGSPTLTQDQIGVDGVANKAWTLEDDASDDTKAVYQAFAVTDDTLSYCASIFIKKTTSASSFPGFGITWMDTITYALVTIDTDNGILTDYAGGGPDGSGIDDAGDFWKVWITDANPTADTDLRIYLYVAVNTDASGTWASATTGSAVFDCAQVEINKAFPSSYIDNDGLAVGADLVTDGVFEDTTESNSYTSDFSGGNDGWSAVAGVRAGDIDGIGGQDDNLRFTVDGTDSTHLTLITSQFTEGKTYRLRLDYYIPSGQSNVDGIHPASGNVIGTPLTATDAWTNWDYYWTADGPNFAVFATDGGVLSFQDAGGDDVFYIRNVIIDEVTLTSWNDDADGLAPGASAGSLTDKASWDGSQAAESILYQSATVPAADRIYQVQYTISGYSAGEITPEFGSTDGDAADGDGTFDAYIVASDTDYLKFKADTDFIGIIDSVTVKEYGKVRAAESGYPRWPIDNLGDLLFAEDLSGGELVTDGAFSNITLAGAKGISGITKANPGVVTLDADSGYIKGDVVYFSGLSEMTELNTEYWKLRSPDTPGAEVLDDPTLNDAAEWDDSDGNVTHDDVAGTVTWDGLGAGSLLTIDSPFIVSSYYRIIIEIDSISAGTLSVGSGSGQAFEGHSGGIWNSSGTKTINASCVNDVQLNLFGDATCDAVISNISVKEVTTFELSANAIGTWDAASLDTSGYGAAETTPGNVVQLVNLTDWTEGDGWHLGVDGAGALSGTVDCDGEQEDNTSLTQLSVVDVGIFQKSIFTLSNYAAGTIRLLIGVGNTIDVKSADGTYSGYKTVIQSDNLQLRGNSAFIGSIDGVSVKQVLNARPSGASGGLAPPHGTLVTWWVPFYDQADMPAGTSGIISSSNATRSLLYNAAASGRIFSHDEVTTPQVSLNWTAFTLYKLAMQWGYLIDNVSKFRVGVDSGSGISWGSDTNYDGSFTIGSFLNLFYNGFGSCIISDIKIYDEILDDSVIDML